MSQPAVPTTIYQARSILTMNPARRAPPTWRCATAASWAWAGWTS